MTWKSIFLFPGCVLLILLIAPRIDTYNYIYASGRLAGDVPVLLKLLGEGRSIVSNMAILQADLYFHRGIGHVEDEHFEEVHDPGKEDTGDDEVRGEGLPKASPFNILLWISEQTGITEHAHLEDDNIKEIVPWLYYASEIDPHNTLAITLTGFYLADRLNKVDEAVSFLRRELIKNPDSWEINAELGRIYFQHLKNYEAAARYLNRAMKLQQEVPHDKFQERFVLSFLAYTYEAMGRNGDALVLFRRVHELFPKDNAIRQRIRGLDASREQLPARRGT